MYSSTQNQVISSLGRYEWLVHIKKISVIFDRIKLFQILLNQEEILGVDADFHVAATSVLARDNKIITIWSLSFGTSYSDHSCSSIV